MPNFVKHNYQVPSPYATKPKHKISNSLGLIVGGAKTTGDGKRNSDIKNLTTMNGFTGAGLRLDTNEKAATEMGIYYDTDRSVDDYNPK